MAQFEFETTPLAGLIAVQRRAHGDERGFLSRIYCVERFAEAGLRLSLAQINHTLTRRSGTVRGMHYQRPPCAEAKFVSCLRGEIFDVAVDLRRGSPTFLKWHADILSAANHRSLLIPAGFAHGFQALTDDCELLYLHTAAYEPAAEGGLNPADPRLSVRWPLDVVAMSDRDRSHPLLTAAFDGLDL